MCKIMTGKGIVKANRYLAKLAIGCAPCAFCNRDVDEETIYGKLYSIGDIYCHYFCVLLSCCLIQKGKDEEGLFGFMYLDILAEIERSKKHKCSFCGCMGATLGCSVAQCKKQFHLPCGRERRAVSLFYDNYKSFCENHAPKQKIPDVIMSKAKLRLSKVKNNKHKISMQNLKNFKEKTEEDNNCTVEPESVCAICYETVNSYPTTETFWPPCCARDAWFHRSCLQRMALSAGVHYLKCPLCNDKENFSNAVLAQGYYIPDRDAAWELEQNAFSEIYERPVVCCADQCECPQGREYDADSGIWDIKLCVLCGSAGSHAACCAAEYYVCAVCGPAAPDQTHLAAIDAVTLPTQDQNSQTSQPRPVMPSRMSLRRTKPKQHAQISQRRFVLNITNNQLQDTQPKSNTELSREDLNLKTPKRPIIINTSTKVVENQILSPLKLLEQRLIERTSLIEVNKVIVDDNVLEKMKEKFRKPKPLAVKKKIVDNILEEIIRNIKIEHTKVKAPIIEWNSPKKCSDNQETVFENNAGSNNENKQLKLKMDAQEDILEKCSDMKLKEPITMLENANLSPPKSTPEIEDDDSSSSTFQLPPEFTAESSNSLSIIDTPKKLKKINIENDSMEISENNQVVNIDVVKIPDSEMTKNYKIPEKTCAFKLSPLNKDILEKNLDIDVESFKNQYLNEVDRKTYCNHNDTDNIPNSKNLSTEKNFALDMSLKRKLESADEIASKKRKITKMVQNAQRLIKNSDIVDTKNTKRKKKLKYKQKHNTKLSIDNKNIRLKIRIKDNELNVKLKNTKKGNKIKNKKHQLLKQYVLSFPHKISSSTNLISRPETDFIKKKRKRVTENRSSDNLKQTSIECFFQKAPITLT